MTGSTTLGFPTTPGAFQVSHGLCVNGSGVTDAFVAKLDPSTATGPQSLIYSTYIGGDGAESGNAIAVDASGNAYVTGTTSSVNFPVTLGAFQSTPTPDVVSSVGFVTKLNAGGSKLLYSTYFGDTCTIPSGCVLGYISSNAIALDSFGSAYIAGNTKTTLLPVTVDAFQSIYSKPTCGTDCSSAFLAKFNPAGSALIYSGYLGGGNDDVATSVSVDQIGDAYVAGHTASLDFPVTAFALQASRNGTGDAFVTKFPLGTTQTLSVSSLLPTAGGNAGAVSPQIFGTGFHAGATANLNCGGASILGSNPSVSAEGRTLNTTFDLRVVSPGTCDVVVTNPGGTSMTLSQAFKVQQGGAPNIQIYLTGMEEPKNHPVAHDDDIVFFSVANVGNVDSPGALIVEPVTAPFSLTSVSPAGVASLAALTAGSTAMWSGNLAAGASQVFTSTASTLSSVSPGSLTADPSASGGLTVNAGVVGNLTGYAACLGPKAVPFAPLCPLLSQRINFDCPQATINCQDGTSTCAHDIQLCETDIELCWNACSANNAICGGLDAPTVIEIACIASSCTQGSSCVTSSSLPTIGASDPNSLVGPSGVGGQRWIAGAQALTYAVSFNNEPTATAPAQQVIVTQPLRPRRINPNLHLDPYSARDHYSQQWHCCPGLDPYRCLQSSGRG